MLLKDWQSLFYTELRQRNEQRSKEFISNDLKQNINASPNFSKETRMQVYSYAFWARQVESLLEDFPTIEKILGKKAFKDLLRDYIHQYPSTNYTLVELGRNLPTFFESEALPAWLCELALFEWNLFEIAYYSLQSLPEVSDIESGSFKVKDTLRILYFKYPMLEIYEEDCEKPEESQILAIVKNEHVEYFKIEPQAAMILAALQAGEPLDMAIAAAGVLSPEKVQEYFQDFIENGFFTSHLLASP